MSDYVRLIITRATSCTQWGHELPSYVFKDQEIKVSSDTASLLMGARKAVEAPPEMAPLTPDVIRRAPELEVVR